MKRTLFIVLISLPFLFKSPVFAGSGTDWTTVDSYPFKIHYLHSDSNYAVELPVLFQTAYADLKEKLKLELVKPVNIFLAPTQRIFDDLTGNTVPDWGEGVADPVRSLIILKTQTISQQRDRLSKLVRHELTHVLIGQSVTHPEFFPKWFNEGMAIYLSGDEEFTAGKAISKALLSDSIIPLDEIDEVLKFQQIKAALAYEESYSFTYYLCEEFGFDSVLELVLNLDGSKSFKQAFQNTFGIDLFETELNWYTYIEKKYRWNFLVDFEIYLWIVILIIFILVFTAIRLRNRRVMLRWEEEERLAGH